MLVLIIIGLVLKIRFDVSDKKIHMLAKTERNCKENFYLLMIPISVSSEYKCFGGVLPVCSSVSMSGYTSVQSLSRVRLFATP